MCLIIFLTNARYPIFLTIVAALGASLFETCSQVLLLEHQHLLLLGSQAVFCAVCGYQRLSFVSGCAAPANALYSFLFGSLCAVAFLVTLHARRADWSMSLKDLLACCYRVMQAFARGITGILMFTNQQALHAVTVLAMQWYASTAFLMCMRALILPR